MIPKCSKTNTSIRKINTIFLATSISALVACGGSSNNRGNNNGEVETSSAVGAIFALSNGHNPATQVGASEDAENLPDIINEVVAFQRMEDGSLVEVGTYETGGVGENIRASGANPLASQDPLIVSEDGRFLFAVNTGSESISSFVINEDMSLTPATLNLTTTGASGAENPVSLTVRGNILYVANTGIFVDGNTSIPEDRNRINSSVIGFEIADDGTLTELEDSEVTVNNIAANVGSIEFSEDGNALYVTERRTNTIVRLYIDDNGLPVRDTNGDAMTSTIAANTDQPFGTDIVVTSSATEVFLVSEGNNGAPGLSAASSYVVESDGGLSVASASTGEIDDPLITQFTFGCWIESVVAPNGTIYAYTANTPDGTLSGYSVADDGTMSRIFPTPDAATTELPASPDTAAGDAGGAGVLDTEITYPYLYQVVSVGDGADDTNNARIAVFEVGNGGILEPMFDLNQENEAFRQGMFVGVAGF